MKILAAKHSGFCFGVRRAVRMAEELADRGERAYTYGNIIHNETVVEGLKNRGIVPLTDVSSLGSGDTLILRAHGVPETEERELRERGVRVVDATCPFVKRIHRIVKAASEEGIPVFVAGEPGHPEVIGTLGYAAGTGTVLETPEDALRTPGGERACLVAQTTLSWELYRAVEAALRTKYPGLVTHGTICDTTSLRQKETAEIAKKSTAVLVIGSHSSANTRRLAQIALKDCENTKIIDNLDKLILANLKSDDIIGLVAGASAPDWMIREVIQVMSELEKTTIETIEAEAPAEVIAAAEEPAAVEAPAAEAAEEVNDFAQAFEKTLTRLHNGQVVTGTVLQIVDGEVYVNVNYKSDGIIRKGEFSADADADPAATFKVGDSIEVEVLKVNDGEGNVLLSRKNVESKKIWDDLMAEAESGEKVFEATAKEVVKGGIIADLDGIRAFVPASQVSTKYIENLNDYVGKEMRLKILEVDKQRKRVVASQKQVLIADAEAAEKAKWEALEVGSKVKGVVRRITDFGAFVDIGGIDGLVHVTDAAWGRVKHTSDVLSIGQEIEVLILNVDAEKKRISLGYKQLQPKPWTIADQKYPVGSIVEGKVVRIVPFGAFVSLESTIDGLIHISQVGVRRVEKVEDEINVGDVVRCKVLEVNVEAKRISLSRRQAILEEQPEIAEQLKAEREERDRKFQEQREQRKEQAQQAQQRREQRAAERPAQQQAAADNGERRERGNDRRRRNSEDGEYELPPVQASTTSMADLLKGFLTEEE